MNFILEYNFCTLIFIVIEEGLGEIQNMKLVDLCLIFMPLKEFCKITSMWDSMKVYLGLVRVTVSAGYLMLINYFENVRDWIRQSDKHEFCSFYVI